jgi:hypothetical protein
MYIARITRKEDKANCLSLGELCSSQLVFFYESSDIQYTIKVPMTLSHPKRTPILKVISK